MFVIGKGLLARISQSGDFPPTFWPFGPTPEIALFGPFLPGRGLKSPAGTNQISEQRTHGTPRGRVTHGRLVRRSRAREGGPRIVLCNVITGLVRHN